MSDEKNVEKVFIVEDDTDLSDMLRAYFQVQGYDVAHATHGLDAVSAIRAKSPSIVLLDIRLPDIDGFEVCRRLRQTRRTRHLPVIFLTEKREREDKLAGLELGAVDYITKPFDIQELRLRVRNALRRAKLSTLTSPVTGLPEGVVVQDNLEYMLKEKQWGVVLAGIGGLNKFRDKFGFVAADDVSRAVTLMVTNAMKESGGEDDFIGQTDTGDFVVLTTAERAESIATRCLMRLRPAVQYFYPAMERMRLNELPASEKLNVRVASITSNDGPFTTLQPLFAELHKRRRA